MCELVGREKEKALLESYIKSDRPEFIAIYGRRRIGKTFLVRQLFGNRLTFDLVGLINGKKEEELSAFAQSLSQLTHDDEETPKDWFEAFKRLREALEKLPANKQKILFIDELPCFDTHLSKFVTAFEHFWNSWAEHQKGLKLIVCGSATSWMISHLIDSHGGLHNRVTHEMHLSPFTLHETELYLRKSGVRASRMSILQLYMAVGGVPYYLSLIDKQKSIEQNIDALFFRKDATLKYEFDRLFKSLYKSPQNYIEIIKVLAATKEGLTRADIAERLNLKSGGYLTSLLEDLVRCDFVREFNTKRKKLLTSEKFYQLADCFTIFYLTFCQKKTSNEHYWEDLSKKPVQNTWFGLAFERVCALHINEIKQALYIGRIGTEFYSWRSQHSTPKVQIDLIIERADDMLNICEMKYSASLYSLQKEEYLKMSTRADTFVSESKSKSGYYLTLVTTNGLTDNEYKSEVQLVTLEDLFKPVAI